MPKRPALSPPERPALRPRLNPPNLDVKPRSAPFYNVPVPINRLPIDRAARRIANALHEGRGVAGWVHNGLYLATKQNFFWYHAPNREDRVDFFFHKQNGFHVQSVYECSMELKDAIRSYVHRGIDKYLDDLRDMVRVDQLESEQREKAERVDFERRLKYFCLLYEIPAALNV